ncbi:P63C domain-containing protein, partial [Morganella morganii]
DLYLRAREAGAIKTIDQQEAARKAEILVRSLAKVGIIALVDEATGYQRDRKRDALASLLEKFIAKEMRPWLRTFQLEFFEELCRVWGYKMPEKPGAYPPVFAHVIRDIVYDRLAPGVRAQLQELKKKNGGKMHQWLTEHAGYGDLTRHLGELTMLLRLTDDGKKDIFMENLNRLKPVLTVDQLIEATESKEKADAIIS